MRIVKLFYPYNDNFVKLSVSRVPIPKGATVYETVDFFLQNIFLKSNFKLTTKQITIKISLSKIINLHNHTGIKDISQIKSMLRQLKSGKDIFNSNKLTNIKLVKSMDGKIILFDGHHSMLSYMFAGKKYLHEIPHLFVEDEKKGYVSDKEICVFFGEHASKIKDNNWKKYVINWQAKKEKQLCNRVQKNMKEVFDRLYDKFSNELYI